MRSKTLLPLALLAVGVLGAVWLVVAPGLGHDPRTAPVSPANDQISSGPRPALPIHLTIPSLHIDAAMAPVGLTPDGDMSVPTGPDGVVWFDLGPRPGENGSAVIAGHEGWKDGIPAVFDHLYQLKKGDMIYVLDEKGTTAAFVVRELRTYGQDEDASAVFGSRDGKAHLNLITCEGSWNNARKSYSGRLVVFADREL